MKIGRFFSLQQGRVGQFLSPRVLVVRTPFRPGAQVTTLCYFGFDRLSQAQRFAQSLAAAGYSFQLKQGQMLPQSTYEIQLRGHADLARTLAFWDRIDTKRQLATMREEPQPSVTAAPGLLPLVA